MESQQYCSAMKDLNRAVELDPTSPDPFMARARCRSRLTPPDVQGAYKDWTCCLQISSDRPHAYMGRAHVSSNLGDFDAAIADYQKAIALDPSLSNHQFFDSLLTSRKCFIYCNPCDHRLSIIIISQLLQNRSL